MNKNSPSSDASILVNSTSPPKQQQHSIRYFLTIFARIYRPNIETSPGVAIAALAVLAKLEEHQEEIHGGGNEETVDAVVRAHFLLPSV